MSKLSYVATFAVGAFIGSAVAWQFAKKKHEELIQKEIESIKEAFGRRCEPCEEEPVNTDDFIKTEEEILQEDRKKYENEVKKYVSDIYVISPEEFGENSTYSIYSITYYADGVLADDTGEILDIEDTIGHEALLAFDEYSDSAVYVRNERYKSDYEVLRDPEAYSEVFKV